MRTQTKEDARDAIIRAGARLLARHGYRKVTMEDIAREAGISRPTLYQYFPNKEEIALSCIDSVYTLVDFRMAHIAAGTQPAAKKIVQMLEARVLVLFDAVHEYREGLLDIFASIREPFYARRAAAVQREADLLAEVIEEGVASSMFRDSISPEAVAQALLVATAGLLPLSLSPAELGAREEVAARLAVLSKLLIDGLCASA